MHVRLQDLTNVAKEFNGLSLWRNWQTESWKDLSLLEASIGNVLRRRRRILRRCIRSRNNNVIAHQAWATKLSEKWDSSTFMDKYDITDRLMQFQWHIFHATQRSKSEKNSKILGDFIGQTILMSMFNDIIYWIKVNQQKCLANATEHTEHEKQCELVHWRF